MPTAFASSEPLTEDELRDARVPRPSRLAEPLEVSPAPAAKGAERLGLLTVGDLLEHLPRDRSEARTIAELGMDEVATVAVEVRSITSRPVRRRGMKPLVEATVADQTGIMKATFFNQPWLERKYRPGTRLMLQGKYQGRNRFRVQFHAETADQVGASGDVATYPATDGLSTTQIAALVRAHRDAIHDVVEPLPARLRAAGRWPDRAAALAAAHFGDQEGGRVRLAFDELLLLQIALLRRRALRREAARAEALADPPSLTARWLEESLPFTPTDDQRRAMEAVDRDLAAGRPMQRLLMGEVGSGKTVVALYAMLRAVEHGAQAALMAPTETLAEQHFATLQKLMPGELLQAALLTGSTTASRRTDLLGKLASGELKLLVGTHALIEGTVEFDRLAVAVVDEQHRFGVNQRRALDRKAPGDLAPHVLHMTATPIPRTLALTAYGDLDVTVLRHLPARAPADPHARRVDRGRAGARLRADPRGARGRAPGVRRLPAGGGVRGAPGARGHRGVRAAAHDRAQGLPRRAPARADEAAREAGGDGGVRGGRRRRARGDDRDRGRDRRAERVGDARRGRRALRDLAAAPATRADRPGSARVGLRALRTARSRRGCAHWPSTATASSSPRSTSSCAARGRCSGTRQSGLAQFRVARLPGGRRAARRRAADRQRAAGGRSRARAARARAARLGGQGRLRRRCARPDPGDERRVEGALRRAGDAGIAVWARALCRAGFRRCG